MLGKILVLRLYGTNTRKIAAEDDKQRARRFVARALCHFTDKRGEEERRRARARADYSVPERAHSRENIIKKPTRNRSRD